MAGELSREMKRKIDAMERINKGDMSPSIFEGATGTQTIIDPSAYTQTFLPGLNISFGTSGNSKTINAVMNLLAGSNITISEPDANGQVTITGNIGGMDIDIADLVDGYVITWDETSQKFILAESASPLAMATETTLGGIKAKDKTTETGEVAIDPTTGKLFAPSSGGDTILIGDYNIDGGTPSSVYPTEDIPGYIRIAGVDGGSPSSTYV